MHIEGKPECSNRPPEGVREAALKALEISRIFNKLIKIKKAAEIRSQPARGGAVCRAMRANCRPPGRQPAGVRQKQKVQAREKA